MKGLEIARPPWAYDRGFWDGARARMGRGDVERTGCSCQMSRRGCRAASKPPPSVPRQRLRSCRSASTPKGASKQRRV